MSLVTIVYSIAGGIVGLFIQPLVACELLGIFLPEKVGGDFSGIQCLYTAPLGGLLGAIAGCMISLIKENSTYMASQVSLLGGMLAGGICLLYGFPDLSKRVESIEYICIIGPPLLCSILLTFLGGWWLIHGGNKDVE